MKDEFFAKYFEGTNFGSTEYAKIVREGLLKVACHYYNGHTLNVILIKLGYKKKNTNTLTDEGRKTLYKLFEEVL